MVYWCGIEINTSTSGFRRNQLTMLGVSMKMVEAYTQHPERCSSKAKAWDYQDTVFQNPTEENKQHSEKTELFGE